MTGQDPKSTPNGLTRLTLLCLGALLLGIGAGLVLRSGSTAAADTGVLWASAITRAWTNAFRLLVLPLVATQMYLAIAKAKLPGAGYGRLALATPAAFAGLLVLTAAITVAATIQLLSLPGLAALSIRGMPTSLPAPAELAPEGSTVGGWVDSLVPPNLIAVAATDNILPVMIFVLVFAVAARRLGEDQRGPLDQVVQAANQVTFTIVDWLLLTTPVVVLALGLQAGATTGVQVGGLLLWFVLVESALLLLSTAALYPVTAAAGRFRFGVLARATLPAQITAATTRSSLATIPALLQGARSLGIAEVMSGSTIPLAGATLKLSRAVSSPVKLLFLAHVLGLPLGLHQIVVFTATILLLSPTTVGVPRVASGTRSLPAYVAAGIPAEYVVLLGATTWLTDVFMTVLNTTGYQAANVLVARLAGGLPARSAAVPRSIEGRRQESATASAWGAHRPSEPAPGSEA